MFHNENYMLELNQNVRIDSYSKFENSLKKLSLTKIILDKSEVLIGKISI